MQALADADNLAAYCRGLVDARLKEARQSADRRAATKTSSGPRSTTRRPSPPARPSATSGSARSTRSTPRGSPRSRRPSSATCATPSTRTTASWPSSRRRPQAKVHQARREVPDAQGAGPVPPRDVVDGDGRAVARGHAAGGRRSSTRSTARPPATARAGTTRPGPIAAVPARRPAGDPLRRDPARPRRPAGRHLDRRPADGGRPDRGSRSPRCGRSRPRPTC